MSTSWKGVCVDLLYNIAAVKEAVTQPTVRHLDVPSLFREPHLLSGYRLPNQPSVYYVASLFTKHNELFNVWTHLLSFIAFCYKLRWWLTEVDVWTEPHSWVILGFSVGTLSYSALSTLAHLFQSKSELAHYTFFQLDYIGIGLNATGSALLNFYFAGSDHLYESLGALGCWVYVASQFVLGVAVCVSCSVAKLFFVRPYSRLQKFLKFGVCGCHTVYGALPLLLRFVVPDSASHTSRDLWLHIPYMATFFIAAFFYTSYVPERLSPGRFDMVGYSHGLFHSFMALTSLLQYDAAWYELKARSGPQATGAWPRPSAPLIGCGFGAMIAACALFVVCSHGLRVQRAEQLTNSKTKVQ